MATTDTIVIGAGRWRAARVVIATGRCDRPAIPAVARHLPADIHQLAPNNYRNPSSLPAGGVLVVGASATGVQSAEIDRHIDRDAAFIAEHLTATLTAHH